MKSNELRVGNWCQDWNGKPLKINGMHISFLEEGGYSESILPILLTPEILEKAGLIHLNSISFDSGDIFFDYNTMEMGITGAIDPKEFEPIFYANCKFLHQLQNLYFALTGEELIIQL